VGGERKKIAEMENNKVGQTWKAKVGELTGRKKKLRASGKFEVGILKGASN